jgi:hypothetical protein
MRTKIALTIQLLIHGDLTAPQLKPVKAARCHGAQGRNLQSLFLRPKVFITNCGIRVENEPLPNFTGFDLDD